jgi:hypothetical protein
MNKHGGYTSSNPAYARPSVMTVLRFKGEFNSSTVSQAREGDAAKINKKLRR